MMRRDRLISRSTALPGPRPSPVLARRARTEEAPHMFTHRVRVAASGAVALVTVLAMTASIASAHAQYGSSTPPADATLSDAATTGPINHYQEVGEIQN